MLEGLRICDNVKMLRDNGLDDFLPMVGHVHKLDRQWLIDVSI